MPDSAPDFRPLRRRVAVGYKSTVDLMTAAPERPNGKADILLLHGAYSNAGVWAENFLPYLASRGFTAHAVSFRGHGASDGDREAWRFGLDDFVADARAALKLIDRPTILVGHSLGGLVAQLCVPSKLVVGLYLMATVPPDGLLAVNWSVAAFDPLLWGEAALAAMDKPLGPDSPLQRALFSTDMPHEDVVRFASNLAHSLLSRRRLQDPAGHRARPDARRPVAQRGRRPGRMGERLERIQLFTIQTTLKTR